MLDSSRFWEHAKYVPGKPQESFDKQFLRDWLTQHNLAGIDNVTIPEEIVLGTQHKYLQIYEFLTGNKWSTTE
jgi:phosphoribosylaminoimidazole-succinocarboxamide synthase